MVSKKSGEFRVYKLSVVVSLDDFNWKIIMSVNIRVKINKCGEDIRLMFEGKCPAKMSEIIKKNQIIFKSRSAINGWGLDITMKQLKRTLRGWNWRSEWQPHMFSKLAGVTHAVINLITLFGAGALECVEDSSVKMTKAGVPNRCRSHTGDEGLVWCGDRGRWDGVEIARAIAVNDHAPGLEVLNKKANGVKFNRNGIIMSKLTNINKVLNEKGNS
jgi:hypothetical protein